MKTFYTALAGIVGLMVLQIFLCSIEQVEAAHHHQNKVATVVAVPVAVPVAPFSATYYTNQARPYTNPPISEEDRIIKKLAKALAAERGEVSANPEEQVITLFQQECMSCHSKQNADERPVFASLESLNDTQRLACILAIVTEKMPKGHKLSPDKVGKLMLELSQKPRADAEAPPVPNPPKEKP